MAQWLKNPPANAGDEGDGSSIPGLGRSPGEGNGNPLLYFCLENLMDRGAWRTTVHMVAKRGHDRAHGIHVTQSQGWHPVTFAVIYQKRDPFYIKGTAWTWGSEDRGRYFIICLLHLGWAQEGCCISWHPVSWAGRRKGRCDIRLPHPYHPSELWCMCACT